MGSKFSQEVLFDGRGTRGIMQKNIHSKVLIKVKEFHVIFLQYGFLTCDTLAGIPNANINNTTLT